MDFDKFDTKEKTFTPDFIDIIEKRCIDAAAANLGLKVDFEYKDKENGRKSSWKFSKFDQYIDLYNGYVDIEDGIKFADDQKQVWVYPSGICTSNNCSAPVKAYPSTLRTGIPSISVGNVIEVSSPV